MEPVELRTDDLLLRFWQPTDAAAVHRACRHPGLRRWAGDVPWLVTAREITRWGFDGNEASRWVVQKAGYEMAGLLRQSLAVGGRLRDCWVGSAPSRDRVAA